MRLRRSDLSAPGITRRRHGRGWSYRAPDGVPLRDEATLDRIAALAVPPAWKDVWICPWPGGHIQAVGTDAAGRRQYRYHDRWRQQRDAAKFDRICEVATRLPKIRQRVETDLTASPPLSRPQVLAAAVRLLDIGFFRVGSEEYVEQNNSFGLTTVHREHVRLEGDEVVFDYPAKSGRRRVQAVADPEVVAVVAALLDRDDDDPGLLAHRADGDDPDGEDAERGWHRVDAREVNDYLRQAADGSEITAKDFRTWSATVLAAVALAVSRPVARGAATSPSARKRAVSRMYREVADYLGNTPAVCRASYVHPRVVDLFLDGHTIQPALDALGADTEQGHLATQGTFEEAVLDLLAGPRRNGRRRRPPKAAAL